MKINDFLSIDNASELEYVLSLSNYRSFIRTLKSSEGLYSFRVHNAQNQIAARSCGFDDKTQRDERLRAFITFVEVEIHGRLQMELF